MARFAAHLDLQHPARQNLMSTWASSAHHQVVSLKTQEASQCANLPPECVFHD